MRNVRIALTTMLVLGATHAEAASRPNPAAKAKTAVLRELQVEQPQQRWTRGGIQFEGRAKAQRWSASSVRAPQHGLWGSRAAGTVNLKTDRVKVSYFTLLR